ncbi:MAG: coproporphyrinogen III oxidase [Rhodobacteraceae bacterium]|nr:MAG: coproporphyrinogen III oxidase [Paracoccaceae bacterium]
MDTTRSSSPTDTTRPLPRWTAGKRTASAIAGAPCANSWKAALAEDWQLGGFGLYIHWPFCAAKCPYCDFNSHVARRIDETRWKAAYLGELDRVAAELPGRVLNTVFFGGGTPSLMSPDTVAAILERVRRLWPVANDLEVTLEANPGSVEAGKFHGFRQAGITRISMGIQALNDTDLRKLGRIHTAAEAMAAFDVARKAFDRVSFDLIYARQDQSVAAWRAELKQALSMAIDHISLYQLTIEDGTAFGDRYRVGKLRGLPDDDSAAEMYEATTELCDAAGFRRYEVSNHARPGSEARHNLIYWRYGDYAGIGPGAHGRITLEGRRHATETHLMPGAWLSAAERGSGESLRMALSPVEQAQEYAMMSLRIADGLDIERHARLSGERIAQNVVDDLAEMGMIRQDGSIIIVTNQGLAVLNAVIARLLGA